MTKFRGVFPAIITPMTPEGALNEAAFREVMEFNIQAGVHGFWVAGGTGESVLLDDDENMRIATIAADQSQGRIANIMHVGASTTGRAARLAEHAARAGVEAICCVPPFFYKPSDEAIVEHYRVVGAAADLPLFVYNLPQATGTEIMPDLMKRIQDGVPQLTGLKHSALTFTNVREFAKMGLSCFVGNSALMLPGLTVGACGCVDGPPNMAPELWVDSLAGVPGWRLETRRGGTGPRHRRHQHRAHVRPAQHHQSRAQRAPRHRLRRPAAARPAAHRRGARDRAQPHRRAGSVKGDRGVGHFGWM